MTIDRNYFRTASAQYGMAGPWGTVEIQCSDKRYIWLEVRTDKQTLEVRVSKAGRIKATRVK